MTPASGLVAVDRYLAHGFLAVRGMSSRFAAIISSATMRLQTENGITGHAAEVGAFEGRFLIALAHALVADERAIGIDHFMWPDAGLRDRFERNCALHGPGAGIISLKVDSRELTPNELLGVAPGKRIRFFHVDGEHTADHLSKDLVLACRTIEPKGVICLDDMLHPGYPTLALTVDEFLKAHREMQVFCIVDREDIVAATKFMLCRREHAAFYADELARAFPQHVWPLGADFVTYKALVLTPAPRLADIG
jgi:methyltransferase family protein